MKAIVAEIDKKQMIVITDKGDFIKVKRQMSVGIGDEIELKPQKTYLTYKRLASMAAVFLVCILLSTGVYAYYTPYSYVSVDINPSIALSLNRFERVIAVSPLNEDAVSLIEGTKNLKNRNIDTALSEIIKRASEKGYIDEEAENQVMVVVSAKNAKQEKELTEAVAAAAANELAKVNESSEVMVENTSVESYKNALANKLSPGKEILINKVREVIPEIKDEEILSMSVKDAMQLVKEGRKAVKAAEKEDKKDDKEEVQTAKDSEEKAQTQDSNDNDKKSSKELEKAASKADKDAKNSDKPKPAAAASKDEKTSSEAVPEKDVKGSGEAKEKDKENAAADKEKKDKQQTQDDKAGVKGDEEHKENIVPEDNSKDTKDNKGNDREKEKKDSKSESGKDKK